MRLGDFLSDFGSDRPGEEGQAPLRTRYLRSLHTAEWSSPPSTSLGIQPRVKSLRSSYTELTPAILHGVDSGHPTRG